MAVYSDDLIKTLERADLLNFKVSGIHSYNCDLRLSVCYLIPVFSLYEMGGACGAYGGGERCAQGSGWET